MNVIKIKQNTNILISDSSEELGLYAGHEKPGLALSHQDS